MRWEDGQEMPNAPHDGTPVLVYYDDNAAPKKIEHDNKKMESIYWMWKKHANYRSGCGFAVACFGGGYLHDESMVGRGPFEELPDWWFLDGDEFMTVLNPTCWWPLPKQRKGDTGVNLVAKSSVEASKKLFDVLQSANDFVGIMVDGAVARKESVERLSDFLDLPDMAEEKMAFVNLMNSVADLLSMSESADILKKN